MFIMPGMENFAPERTLSSSGFDGVAQLLAGGLFQVRERVVDLLLNLVGNLLVVLEVQIADVGGDGEARRHGHAGPAHFGQAGAFAAEHIFHLSVAFGGAAAERVYMFCHRLVPIFQLVVVVIFP